MKTSIAKTNNILAVLLGIFIVLGLLFLLFGKDSLSKGSFLSAVFSFPLVLATKGIQFIAEKQLYKASISIVILSVFCILSLLFVFV